ncbi:type II toxin-antitoxin system death-on-curing family toxin [Agromyces atrinae]|uniref:type II toxin-antitoxin system death-on-curing family toxin n=1 Tax=Agromyces atrinae TaxID=592376 RepID=UPI001F56AFDB|nr:type II toxin-antitoxin system death-on-curing family toxin [Agromyces atrinae]MCI2957117.1 type II toxin-antitoxin system death-on-curing family toxin [Agromyces atrinae]
MASRVSTPASLARELGCDVDDVLLMLWDGGIDYPVGPQSQIRAEDINKARMACGVSPIKERLLVTYWEERLGYDRHELTAWATEIGVAVRPNARRLPKGALARFERAMRANGPQNEEPPKPEEKQERKPLAWRQIGHVRDQLRHLTPEEIEAIHFQIADDFRGTPDPIAPAGVRSAALLDSAAGRSSTGMSGFLKYPTAEMAAAALMHSVIHNHPFYNGNKRTALVSMLAFLDENGLMLNTSQTDVFKWTVRIASHRLGASQYAGDQSDIEVQLMSSWLAQRCRNVEAGERVVTFAELRRRLQFFGCNVSLSGSAGGKAMISREVPVMHQSRFGRRTRTEVRRFWLPFGGDGRQVSRGRIKDLRQTFQLSDEFGVDSASFYGSVKHPVDAFIAEYRKTLRRLAKL